MTGALDDLRVLDLSDGVAGASATRLLADLGAEVVKVEPPAGDVLRRLGPFPGGIADPERSGLHLHFNANKRSVILDLDRPSDRRRLDALIVWADVVVESYDRQRVTQLSVAGEALRRLNPRLVVVSVTPFGRSGPYEAWRSDEIVQWAMGGWMQFVGDPERHPLLMPGYQAELHAGQLAAAGALAAVRDARRSGTGQDVEVSHFESMAIGHMIHLSTWLQDGRVVKRTGVNAVTTSDGFVEYTSALSWDMILVLIDRAELLADEAYATLRARAAKATELVPMIREWTGAHPSDEVESSGQELRIPVTAARTVDALMDGHPQMTERGFALAIEHPIAGVVRHPGFPYKLTATPCTVRRPAPVLGEHTFEVLAEVGEPRPHPAVNATASSETVPDVAAARGRDGGGWHRMRSLGTLDPDAPLAGLKVVEVTAYWAGPLAGRWLSNLGADVIKVEYPDRLARRSRNRVIPSEDDAAVGPAPDPAVSGAADAAARLARREPYHRGHLHNEMNHGKRGVALDLSVAEAREVFLDLAAWADVVIENNSARVMPNFGLGYDDLAKANPSLIMASISAFGATGPWRDYIAFGSNIELSSGVFSQVGYAPGENWKTGSFYGDPVGGNLATVALLAALLHRDRTGLGQWIDLSLNEASLGMLADQVLEYTMNGTVPPPMGARSRRHAPQGVYRCTGDDSWVAVVVRDAAEWNALCGVLRRDDLAGRAELRDVEGRRSHHDEIDNAIGEWAASRFHRDAAFVLQRAGVPAGPLLTNRELARDPHLYGRGFCVFVEQPGVGVVPYPAWPWLMSKTRPGTNRHPPLLGEHNDEVFRDVLGYDEARIAALYECGATSFPDPGPQVPPDAVGDTTIVS